jgi:hypothetical protein
MVFIKVSFGDDSASFWVQAAKFMVEVTGLDESFWKGAFLGRET